MDGSERLQLDNFFLLKYLLNAHFVPVTMLSIGNIIVSKTNILFALIT